MPRSDVVATDRESPSRLDLRRGTHAIFGYGSLLSIASLERTLGRPYDGPRFLCELRGWRRTWDVAMPNERYFAQCPDGPVTPRQIIYLNVRREASSTMNGVVFVVSADELESYDRREWIYSRERVNDDLPGLRVAGGDVWLYVGKAEYVISAPASWREAGIRTSYVQMLAAGHSEFGQAFRDAFERSTQPLPKHLVFEDLLEGA